MFSAEEMATILSTLLDLAFILMRSGRYAALFGGRDAPIWVEGQVQALEFRGDGRGSGAVGGPTNITERHELEQRLLPQSRGSTP